MLPLGGLLFLGTELIPLFPHSEQKCLEIKKGGGEQCRLNYPVNRFLVTDLGH